MHDNIFLDSSGERAINDDVTPIEPDVVQADAGPSLEDLMGG